MLAPSALLSLDLMKSDCFDCQRYGWQNCTTAYKDGTAGGGGNGSYEDKDVIGSSYFFGINHTRPVVNTTQLK